MKKLFLFLLAGLFLASCGTVKYSTHIDHRDISQRCHFAPMDDSIKNLVNTGYINATPVDGGTYLICDSVYTLSMTWSQVRAYDRSHGMTPMFWGGTALMGSTIGTYAYLTSIATIVDISGVLLPVGGIVIGGYMIGGSSEWARANGARQIRKSDYGIYVASPANEARFWNGKAQAY